MNLKYTMLMWKKPDSNSYIYVVPLVGHSRKEKTHKQKPEKGILVLTKE